MRRIVVALSSFEGSGSDAAAAGNGSTGSVDPAQPSGTFTGDAVDTRWGPVQVEINSYAAPVLNGAVVAAQSAQIDNVSGATVTSVGYHLAPAGHRPGVRRHLVTPGRRHPDGSDALLRSVGSIGPIASDRYAEG